MRDVVVLDQGPLEQHRRLVVPRARPRLPDQPLAAPVPARAALGGVLRRPRRARAAHLARRRQPGGGRRAAARARAAPPPQPRRGVRAARRDRDGRPCAATCCRCWTRTRSSPPTTWPPTGCARPAMVCHVARERAEALGARFYGLTRGDRRRRRAAGACACGADRGRLDRDQHRRGLRRPLGARAAGAGRTADPDAADAAPVRLDEPAAVAARRGRRGDAPDPAPPGPRPLLPPARRRIRHRLLRPRLAADRRARARARLAGPPGRAGPVHARALRERAGLVAGARAGGARGRHRGVVQRPLRVHGRRQPAAGAELVRRRPLAGRGPVGHARRRRRARRGRRAAGPRPGPRARSGPSRPLPAAPRGAGLRAGARVAAVRRGIRRPAPAAAAAAPARAADGALPPALRGARRRAHGERRLGARRSGSRATRGLPEPPHRQTRRRLVVPVLERDRGARAPRDPHRGRPVRPHALHEGRGRGCRRGRLAEPRLRVGDGSPGRPRRLHDGARRTAAGSSATSRSRAWPRIASWSSPAAARARATSPGCAACCPRAAASRCATSPAPGRWSASGARVRATCCSRWPTSTSATTAFPYMGARRLYLEHVPALALRISYAGELGWELYVPTEYGRWTWDRLLRGGPRARRSRPAASAPSRACASRRATASPASTCTASTRRTRPGSASRCTSARARSWAARA